MPCFSYCDKLNDWKTKEIVKFLKTYPIVYKIFRLPVLNIVSNEDLDSLIAFLKGINNKFLRYTSINFDHTKLEAKFHKSYSQLLIEQGLEKESERIHDYFSSKGIMIYPESMDKLTATETIVPKSLC